MSGGRVWLILAVFLLLAGVRSPFARPRAEAAEDVEDPQLEELLNLWSCQSATVETFDSTFIGYRYDHKYKHEYRSTGRLVLQAGRKSISRVPGVITSEMKRRTKDQGGRPCEPYELKPDDASQMVLTKDLLVLNGQPSPRQPFPDKSVVDRKAGLKVCICDFYSGMIAQLSEFPIGEEFLNIDPVLLKQRYEIKVVMRSLERGESILRFFPLKAADKRCFQSKTILLDERKWVVKAMKIIDPTGNEEQHFSFQRIKLNEPVDEALFAVPEPRREPTAPVLSD